MHDKLFERLGSGKQLGGILGFVASDLAKLVE